MSSLFRTPVPRLSNCTNTITALGRFRGSRAVSLAGARYHRVHTCLEQGRQLPPSKCTPKLNTVELCSHTFHAHFDGETPRTPLENANAIQAIYFPQKVLTLSPSVCLPCSCLSCRFLRSSAHTTSASLPIFAVTASSASIARSSKALSSGDFAS